MSYKKLMFVRRYKGHKSMSSTALEVVSGEQYQGIIPSDTTDQQLIAMWLDMKKGKTKEAYRGDIERFLLFVRKPLQTINLLDLQAYQQSMEGLRQATINRRLAVVRALLTFGNKTGYLRYNVGSFVKLEKVDGNRARRIIGESDVVRMIDREPNKRNHALLRLLYHAGLRISEVVSLEWADVLPREDGGQISIMGKRDKRRYILLSQGMYDELVSLPRKSQYVFASRQSDRLTIDMVSKIVHAAALRAGISCSTDEIGKLRSRVSPHWLRHSHASHALDHGAPVHLVMETMGHESLATTSIYTHARPGASSSQFLLV